MNTLGDILTYIRRIIKSATNESISDALLIDYVNRFYIMDVPAELQLFDMKTKYSFQTVPGVDRYNMPLYDLQTETTNPLQTIGMYPVYQGFLGPAYVNGVQVQFQTQQNYFFREYPNIVQNPLVVGQGNGTAGPYTFQVPFLGGFNNPPNPPFQGILRGHIDITGIIATGENIDPPLALGNPANLNTSIPSTSIDPAVWFTSIAEDGSNIVIQDSGQFLATNQNYGLLMAPGAAPFGYTALQDGGGLGAPYATTQNTINYLTGVATNVYFPKSIPQGTNITCQCYFFQNGLPRSLLYYNNVITLRVPPAYSYLVELDAYLSPAAFFNTTAAIPFAYMAEYIARGAARKILSDTLDEEQFNFYEKLYLEQKSLVHIRSLRQWTSTRTQTIYSIGQPNQAGIGYYGSSQ